MGLESSGAHDGCDCDACKRLREREELILGMAGVYDLLAAIYGDGGRHTKDVGVKQSTKDAMQMVRNLHSKAKRYDALAAEGEIR